MMQEPGDPGHSVHPLWQAAHRPFFLFAGLWAILVPSIWLWPGQLGFAPGLWHAHELLFATGGAAVGGYVLTALPSWTGRSPVSTSELKMLAGLWLTARLSLVCADFLPIAALLAGAVGYFVVLGLVMVRELIAARVTSKVSLVLALAMLTVLDGLFVGQLQGSGVLSWVPLATVLVFAFLISVVGGRAIPAFTHNSLPDIDAALTVRNEWRYGWLYSGSLVLAAVSALTCLDGWGGTGLIAAGGLQLWRMRGWQSLRAWQNSSLFLLHAAWVWLPMGLVLTGMALVRPDLYSLKDALHALSMGAMGTMIVAVSGRAAMARTGGPLVAGRTLLVAFVLIWLAALMRVLAPFMPAQGADPIAGAAILWMAGWSIYLLAMRPALSGPAMRPVFSGPKRRQGRSDRSNS